MSPKPREMRSLLLWGKAYFSGAEFISLLHYCIGAKPIALECPINSGFYLFTSPNLPCILKTNILRAFF